MAVWDDFPPRRRPAIAPALAGLAFLAGGLLASPCDLDGQLVHNVHPSAAQSLAGNDLISSERLRFEPWGGALWDVYRNEGGSGAPAWIGAVRLGYELGAAPTLRGWRVIGEIARAEAAEAGTATLQDSLLVGFRTEWWLATAGMEWDLIGGWQGLTLEGRAGAAWIEREIVGGDSIPAGTPGTTDQAEPEPFPALVLGASAWRHLTHRLQLRLRVEDVITDPFDEVGHSPALGLGLRFVFE